MISLSILGIKDDLNKIDRARNLDIDYVHMDVMDGEFVSNTTDLTNIPKFEVKRDIHLMVNDVYKYIDMYSSYEPEYITFHLEVGNTKEYIDYIHSLGIGVGISIKPNTDVSNIIEYLDMVDLVLVMSVEPGKGGQEFIPSSLDKIKWLNDKRKENNYKYKIEVDGGVNNNTYLSCLNSGADILVVGSFITNKDDMESALKMLK